MEQIPSYNPKEVEETVDQFWNKNEVYKKAKDKNKNKQKFYYLDGPPYTSGKIHIGHAWGKSLRDMLMRYKRMQGFDVWDRTGFDMHGLPISHKVEAKLGIKGKEAIEKHGVEDFIKECKMLAIKNMNSMIVDFKKLGVWMDFDNPYKPIDNSYIEGIWWLIKKAHENNRLYEGKRTLTWCPSCETSAAKHELEYKDLKDTSIFVKFKVKDTEKSKISGTTSSGSSDYLVIWTTTPWTIPFNLAIMVNPNVDYVKIKVKGENWIVAKELADSLVKDLLEEEYEILDEFKGSTLEGMKYEHFFSKDIDYPKAEKMHTVLLSSEYVDTTAGSGLVHCAPGCGPEDYEVGHRNGLPAFNNVNEQGIFENMGKFGGLKAKFEDKKFIEEIEDAGALVASTKISHEYPHCERCHNPIVFRSTKQWFFKVEDLKEEMKTLNKDINWVPDWAGNKQFHSWLDNLRDNSITKQIHWGTPFPVWKCESCTEYTVIGSSKELKELSGSCPADLHKPFIDKVKIPCKCGKEQIKTPDVLDVWVDAGSASWLCLDYPVRTDLFEEMFPADFILEGKDQIRGWFNLLFVASMVSMKKPSFKAAYMHGFINDSNGRKMSKSLGNVISPSEITDKYGADTLRYYMIGAANPGLDMNYNFEDLTVKFKNISIFWNVHKYVIDTSRALNINPTKLDEKKVKLSVEEKYILSKLNSTIKNMTEHLDKYELNQIPDLVEELFLELSRTYIQLVRDKLTIGDEEEKISALYTMNKVLTEGIKMFAIISPYVSEAMYQNLKEEFDLAEESIHFFSWPEYDKNLINEELEADFVIAKDTIQSILAAREKVQLGVRWPIKEVTIVARDKNIKTSIDHLKDLVMVQTNVKNIKFSDVFTEVEKTLKPNYKPMGQDFGKLVQRVAQMIPELDPNKVLSEAGETIEVDGEKLTVKEKHVTVERKVSEGYETSEFKHGDLYLDKARTFELDAEGYSREVIRRVQNERKIAELQKSDSINLLIVVSAEMKKSIDLFVKEIQAKCGCENITIQTEKPSENYKFNGEGKIKEENIIIMFNML